MFFLNFKENFSRFSSSNNPDYDTDLNSLNIYHIALHYCFYYQGVTGKNNFDIWGRTKSLYKLKVTTTSVKLSMIVL